MPEVPMPVLFHDMRQAFRSLRRRPGLSTVAILILALGSGTVTAVYSVLDRALLRPVPAAAPERWVHLVLGRGQSDRVNANLSYPLYTDVRDQAGVFDAVVAHSGASLTLGADGAVERVEGAGISAGGFRALGIPLPLGREIAGEEDRPGAAARVLVLSDRLWRRRFGADRAVLGRAVPVNGEPYTVIGVAPPGFLGLQRGRAEEAWVPVTTLNDAGPEAFTRRTVSWLDILARRAPGMGPTQAQAGLDLLARQLQADSLLSGGQSFIQQSGAEGLTALVGDLRRPLGLLFGASCLVLLVAAANLAGLLLARAASRRREIAVRQALGAGRGDLARLFLCEGLVLSLLGAAGGIVVAVWLNAAAPALRSRLGPELELGGSLDLRLLGFVALVGVVLAGLIAAGPVLWSSRLELAPGLKESAPTGERTGSRVRGRLVVAQLALAVVLVSGGMLLALTTRRLAAVDPGYDPTGVQLARVDLGARGYNGTRAIRFWEQVTGVLRERPAVAAATMTQTVTPNPGGMRFDQVPLEGSPVPAEQVDFDVNLAGPDYFALLRIPVRSGRAFTAADRRGAPDVAIINQAMARRYWGDDSPLGRRVWLGGDTTQSAAVVVGVVADGKYRTLREPPRAMLYLSALQQPPISGTLMVRARPGVAPEALTAEIRAAVRAADPGLPVFDLRPLAAHLALAHATERLLAFLALFYAGLATLLAAVGLFGLLSYNVTRQIREIGVRLALGARPVTIRQQFLARGLASSLWGVGLGLTLSAVVSRTFGGLLFGVSPFDPLVLGGAAAVLLLVAGLASWLPAARAARADPMSALRSD